MSVSQKEKYTWFSRIREKIIYLLPLNLIFLLTCVYFSSMEVFTANYVEFGLSVKHVWWITLLFSLLIVFVITFVELFLPWQCVRFFNAAVFAVSICSYIQEMFLNQRYLKSFTGEEQQFSQKVLLTNLIVWIFLVVFVFAIFFIYRKKSEILHKVALYMSISLILIQCAGGVQD